MAMVALCLVPLAGIMAQAAPAAADHMGTYGHWTHAPWIFSDGQYDANVQDAAYYWQDRGFNGYYPPLPYNVGGSDCATPREGVIRVCTVPRSVVNAYACAWSNACWNNDGYTYDWHYNGTDQNYGTMTLIASDLTPYRRQQVWRHEIGHALGLGHTLDQSCVMRADANVPLGTVCYHDASSMGNLYPGPGW